MKFFIIRVKLNFGVASHRFLAVLLDKFYEILVMVGLDGKRDDLIDRFTE